MAVEMKHLRNIGRNTGRERTRNEELRKNLKVNRPTLGEKLINNRMR
jgi:hypothetical protein